VCQHWGMVSQNLCLGRPAAQVLQASEQQTFHLHDKHRRNSGDRRQHNAIDDQHPIPSAESTMVGYVYQLPDAASACMACTVAHAR
jgi:hypothetical protein